MARGTFARTHIRLAGGADMSIICATANIATAKRTPKFIDKRLIAKIPIY